MMTSSDGIRFLRARRGGRRGTELAQSLDGRRRRREHLCYVAKGITKGSLAELTFPSRATTGQPLRISNRSSARSALRRRRAPVGATPEASGGVQGGAAPPLLHASTPMHAWQPLDSPGACLGMLRAGWPRRWSRLMQPSKEEASWTCTMSCAKQGVA